jgi:cell division protein FtsL
MLITSSKSAKQGVRKRTVNRVVHVGPLSLRFITLLMLAGVTLFFLAQSSQSATKTYTIRELDLKQGDLTKERDRLQIETTRLKSLQSIQGSVDKVGLEQSQ